MSLRIVQSDSGDMSVPSGSGIIQGEGSLYIPVVFMLVLIAFVGLYRPGYVVGGDNWPTAFIPGNHDLEHSMHLWGYTVTGMGSPQFNPSWFALGLWGRLWLSLGLPGPGVQFIFVTAMLIWEGVGMIRFVRVLFPEQRFAALAAGIGLPVSFINTVGLTNYVQVFAFGYFPWLAALLISHIRRPRPIWRSAAQIGLASLGLLIISANPPLVVAAILWALAWIVLGWCVWHTFRRTWMAVCIGVCFAALLNGWWMYAASVALYGSNGTTRQVFAGPLDWGWVSGRASLLNLLSMQGFWAWPSPEVFPWAGLYTQGILQISLFVPLLLASMGIIWAPYRRRTLLLLAIILVSLFLAKGLHPPLEGVNRFLYLHVPFFWLLRDPQAVMDCILYPALYTMAALGVAEVLRGTRILLDRCRLRAAWRIPVLSVAGSAVVLLLTTSGYALANGAAVPDETMDGAAKTVVTIPRYWYDVARYLRQNDPQSGVLMLPNDDFYQMPYTWGYYGVDAVAQTFIDQPLFYLTSGLGYLGASASFQSQQDHLLSLIRKESIVAIAPILQAMGIKWVIERRDVDWAWPGRSILSAPFLVRYLGHQPDIVKVRSFGQLDVYRVTLNTAPIEAYRGAGAWLGPKYPRLAELASLLGGDVPWISSALNGSLPISAWGWLTPSGAAEIASANRPTSPLAHLQTSAGTVYASGKPPEVLPVQWQGKAPIYSVKVPRGARLLVLRTSYAPGWVVEGRGHALPWPHVVVDGFLNGWIVPRNVSDMVQLRYAPATTFDALLYISLGTICIVVGLLLTGFTGHDWLSKKAIHMLGLKVEKKVIQRQQREMKPR